MIRPDLPGHLVAPGVTTGLHHLPQATAQTGWRTVMEDRNMVLTLKMPMNKRLNTVNMKVA